MNPLALALFLLFALALLVWLARFNLVRIRVARAAMRKALEGQGFTILSARICWTPMGPFGFDIARHQPVFRVVVAGLTGVQRRGWVRCFPFSDRTAIAWEPDRRDL